MPTIASSVVIEKPVDEVFAFVVDMGNEAKWQSSVVEAELTSEGPMGAGSTGREVRMLMGRRVETSYRITEWDANRRYSLESTSGPISVQAAYTFRAHRRRHQAQPVTGAPRWVDPQAHGADDHRHGTEADRGRLQTAEGNCWRAGLASSQPLASQSPPLP